MLKSLAVMSIDQLSSLWTINKKSRKNEKKRRQEKKRLAQSEAESEEIPF